MNKTIIRGFTLIELLIVIVIVGILSASLIPRLKGLQDKAKYTRVQKDLETFRSAAFLAQTNTQKTLAQITMNVYKNTSRWCSLTGDLKNIPDSDLCMKDRLVSLRAIENAADLSSGSLSNLYRDPWGSPYIFDENEGEYGVSDCRQDSIQSVGPDGILAPAIDNRKIYIPPIFCSGSY